METVTLVRFQVLFGALLAAVTVGPEMEATQSATYLSRLGVRPWPSARLLQRSAVLTVEREPASMAHTVFHQQVAPEPADKRNAINSFSCIALVVFRRQWAHFRPSLRGAENS